ncbi:MAG: hypothetical protein OXC95_13015 [Dehalococcoidia bacterium]|nr:hypothetical protein [Dehalococcoidia bacterium]
MADANIPTPIIFAAFTGAVSLFALSINAWLTGHRDRANRRRELLSKAFAAAVAFQEFPYVVRRRRSSSPEDERIRISTELRKVQEDIAYYSSWLVTESRHVAKAYDTLISELREVVGKQIRKAWTEPPVQNDDEMNMDDLGLDVLKELEEAFLLEAADHLSAFPRWFRRMTRGSS